MNGNSTLPRMKWEINFELTVTTVKKWGSYFLVALVGIVDTYQTGGDYLSLGRITSYSQVSTLQTVSFSVHARHVKRPFNHARNVELGKFYLLC